MRLLTPSTCARIARRHAACTGAPKAQYDAVVVGGGHNGLVAAAYLAKAGKKVCVLERRAIIGGAAVTESIVPGFQFSRASYVLSLLRPVVYEELELQKHGLVLFRRNPHSFTPLLRANEKSKQTGLLLGADKTKNAAEIAAFSQRDAAQYLEYENLIAKCATALQALLDAPPFDPQEFFGGGSLLSNYLRQSSAIKAMWKLVRTVGVDLDRFFELFVAPSAKILDRWFDTEILKATLATDSLVGMLVNSNTPGSAYVLMHHCMGELNGVQGAWYYVKGGMGAVSQSIASSARSHGAEIYAGQEIREIICDKNGVKGVVTEKGQEIRANLVLANCTPQVTFGKLIKNPISAGLSEQTLRALKHFSYASGTTKINFAVKELPAFLSRPSTSRNVAMEHHRGSIHFNCESLEMLNEAYNDLSSGSWSRRPLIEMTIPSVYDSSLAPPGCHVVQCFIQYTPYKLQGSESNWTDERREQFASLVVDWIDQYAPGFKQSIIGKDVLTPVDLENVLGLTGGSIFHGALSLDQIYFNRPARGLANYRTPIKGLYLSGSASHPGGGVSGSVGRLAAQTALADLRRGK